MNFTEQSAELVAQYTRLTGREARVSVYEHALYDYFRAGFTPADLVLVLGYLLRENKRNSYQYSIKLGHLIGDHERFMDLLGEAKAKLRNSVKPASARQEVLQAFRPVADPEMEGKGNCHRLSEFIRKPE